MILEAALVGLTRFLVGGRAYWLGAQPTSRQRIYFANHRSNLDTVVLWAALPPPLRRRTRPVAAKDYWATGRLRRLFALDVLRAVLIERGGGREALDPLHAALAEGDSLIIFPEGGRGPGPAPLRFKTGLYHLAMAHPDVQLVPVWLDDVGRALPKGVSIPIPVSTRALIGAPIAPGPGEARDAFLARARDAVVALGVSLHPDLPVEAPEPAPEPAHA
ncbi:1-acyl-sn-glycerol-3-phosphate acyltransferase [Amaricoccus sp.]|uniref:lysophospholipid acyltransferase family protein n=1 Tax=Amaricoccus sp. TaxID=1872485 RepID=UPI001B48F301|nr:lysophospholipid acyltransferase family protein [Amaricoccus sp.]MBP7001325.1 1-acyl-sn-glycerol-3-phosphate acyltransferase [Amaricoccus sp.]